MKRTVETRTNIALKVFMAKQAIQHTSTDKVHVAGGPVGSIQRCERCASILHRDDGHQCFWPVAAFVLRRRSGARVLTSEQMVEFPICEVR